MAFIGKIIGCKNCTEIWEIYSVSKNDHNKNFRELVLEKNFYFGNIVFCNNCFSRYFEKDNIYYLIKPKHKEMLEAFKNNRLAIKKSWIKKFKKIGLDWFGRISCTVITIENKIIPYAVVNLINNPIDNYTYIFSETKNYSDQIKEIKISPYALSVEVRISLLNSGEISQGSPYPIVLSHKTTKEKFILYHGVNFINPKFGRMKDFYIHGPINIYTNHITLPSVGIDEEVIFFNAYLSDEIIHSLRATSAKADA